MTSPRDALAAVLKNTLNPRQEFARRQILSGVDYNYTVQGGPGSGKSMLLTHVAAALERQYPGQTQILSIQRGPANAYAQLGLNATSVASFVGLPELTSTVIPPSAFRRRYPREPASHPFFVLWDEYAFATADNIALVLACISVITTGRVQFLAFGDVGQLEPPSGGLPAICHPIFNNTKRMRACVLTDMSPRFHDPELLYVVQQLRDYSKPISARAERILVERSYSTTMWRRRQPEITLCVTNAAVRCLNLRQWHAANHDTRAIVHSVAGKRAAGPRPHPVHLVYKRKVIFIRAYIPPKAQEDSRYVANGEMATLISGPRGVVNATTDVLFVVQFEAGETIGVQCTQSSTGESRGYYTAPFMAAAGMTMAKIQGLTIPTLTVDLTGCGRVSAMVAISRARKFDNLDGNGGVSIVNYEPNSADDMSAIAPAVLTAVLGFAKLEKNAF